MKVERILETHADPLSAARYLQQRVGGRIASGENIRRGQATFKKLHGIERNFPPVGSQFDKVCNDNETFRIGEVAACAMLVAGYTPTDIVCRIDDSVFVGERLFMPHVGAARAIFPGGDAATLYRCGAGAA